MPLRIRCLPTPQPAGHCGGSSAQIIRPAFVGSSITNLGATLLPMISRNLQNAMLIPEQIQTQRFNNSMTLLQAIVSGLGSSSSGTSAGPGLGYVRGSAFMDNFGKGLGQQIPGTVPKQPGQAAAACRACPRACWEWVNGGRSFSQLSVISHLPVNTPVVLAEVLPRRKLLRSSRWGDNKVLGQCSFLKHGDPRASVPPLL